MRKLLIILSLLLVSIGISPYDVHALFKSAKVTLLVVDEEGLPLEGIDAGVGFEKNTGWGTDATAQRGLTDTDGRFTATGSCNGHIGYGARKEGYYRSHYDYDFKDLGAFGWEPWNPELKVVMRKIENPVPMYARHAGMERKIRVPELSKDIGFDLIVSDWVAPYGEGKEADFVITLEKKFTSAENYWAVLTLRFSNKNDGIINIKEKLNEGSVFNLPRFAPNDGYQDSFKFMRSRTGASMKKNYSSNDSYVFRIRSAEDDSGIVGLYGKIRGVIEIGSLRDDNPKINFKYYLNPGGTRNLEFDPRQNLFGKLPMLEEVKEP
jgi:hypothetical protein